MTLTAEQEKLAQYGGKVFIELWEPNPKEKATLNLGVIAYGKVRGASLPNDLQVRMVVYDRQGKVVSKATADTRTEPDGRSFITEAKAGSFKNLKPGLYAVAVIATSADEVLAERYVPIQRLPLGFEDDPYWSESAPLGQNEAIDPKYGLPKNPVQSKD